MEQERLQYMWSNKFYIKIEKEFNKIVVFLFLTLSINWSLAQTNNFAPINKAMSDEELVKIAATITPTESQMRWQKLELTGFFHFGMNTFTGNEWGNGKENPKLFNPTELDVKQWVKIAKDGRHKTSYSYRKTPRWLLFVAN